MNFEGFGSIKWPQRGRQQKHSMKYKRIEEGKPVQSPEAISGRKLVFLHDWWLVKAEPDSDGKQLGIGGFTSKENYGIRCFSSASIVKRQDAVTLQTVDGITIMVHGYLNMSHTLENGFSQEVCDHFLIGFPYYWEDFASVSASEEQDNSSASKGVSPSYEYTTPIQETRRGNMTSGNTIDDIPTEASSAPTGSMQSAVHRTRMTESKTRNRSNRDGGPLTRSKTRLRIE